MSDNPEDRAVAVRDLDVQALIEQAIAKGTNIDVMERLFAMARDWKAMAARDAYFRALAEFQAACPTIGKSEIVDYPSKQGGRVNYRYAPLDVIVTAVRGQLLAYGFSYTVTTKQDEKSVTAICNAHHDAGHSEATEFTIPIDLGSKMNAAQQVASALTYAKRYAFCNAFGLMTGDEDDDARSLNKTPDANGGAQTTTSSGKSEFADRPICPTCKKPLREYKKGGYYCPKSEGGCGQGWDKDEWAAEQAKAAGARGENMSVDDDYLETDAQAVTGIVEDAPDAAEAAGELAGIESPAAVQAAVSAEAARRVFEEPPKSKQRVADPAKQERAARALATGARPDKPAKDDETEARELFGGET